MYYQNFQIIRRHRCHCKDLIDCWSDFQLLWHQRANCLYSSACTRSILRFLHLNAFSHFNHQEVSNQTKFFSDCSDSFLLIPFHSLLLLALPPIQFWSPFLILFSVFTHVSKWTPFLSQTISYSSLIQMAFEKQKFRLWYLYHW